MIRQTSKQSYDTIKQDGSLGKRQLEVYEHLYNNGPLNANEIFRGLIKYTTITQANIHARLYELRNFRVVREVGKKHCDITGMQVLVFDVTKNLPDKSRKRPTPKEKIRKLAAALLENCWCGSRRPGDICPGCETLKELGFEYNERWERQR